MQASLHERILPPFSPARHPATTRSHPRNRTTAEMLSVLSGGALLTAGLFLRSYRGLALAALGGFLIYRGLARPLRKGAVPEGHLQSPPVFLLADEPKETSRTVDAPTPEVTPSEAEAVSQRREDAPLTAAEHAAAQVK